MEIAPNFTPRGERIEMPYEWTKNPNRQTHEQLDLWPFSSLPHRGFASFIMTTFILITLPLYVLIGTILFWALLPFLMITVGAIYYAIRKNFRDRSIIERLTLDTEQFHLLRQEANGERKDWECNVYWARVHMHEKGGPIPNYVTLSGNGREVEIGAFLSEDERVELFAELQARFKDYRNRLT